MKVRFSSQKEKSPTDERGMKVLYAPGKRVAFRLRWYLILFLVAAPFLWFMGRLLMGVMLVEAPARITQPTMEIRALENGRVNRIEVEPGDRVEAGDLLVSLDNAALRDQMGQLRATLGTGRAPRGVLEERQMAALERRLDRAGQRVEALRELVGEGAATRGELEAAENELDARENELAGYERSLQAPETLALTTARERQQLSILEQRLEQLTLRAPEAGRVRDMEVVQGENVGSGGLLMRLERQQAPRIHVFLETQRIDLAREGQPLSLRFPDGEWHEAKVHSVPSDVQRLPPDLRSPFGGNELGLLVEVELIEDMPEQWRVNNVPLTARFPNRFQRLLD